MNKNFAIYTSCARNPALRPLMGDIKVDLDWTIVINPK
jgi:hypothetical protein